MSYTTQNELLLKTLMNYYNENPEKLDCMLNIINGESKISLRLVDWFATNYSKQKFTVYSLNDGKRFKVYADYKLKLRAYSKKRFDPFCRWDRITIPYKEEGVSIQTTIGQLNFFKWAIENDVIKYIDEHHADIEYDMNTRNSSSRRKHNDTTNKTRKKREELSVSASKSIKKETVEIVVKFD